MDELEPWGYLKGKDFSREWLWVYLNHMRESVDRLNEYLDIAGIKPLYGSEADEAISVLKKSKITDEDVNSVLEDVMRLSKTVETEEDLYTLKEFKKTLIIAIINNKLSNIK